MNQNDNAATKFDQVETRFGVTRVSQAAPEAPTSPSSISSQHKSGRVVFRDGGMESHSLGVHKSEGADLLAQVRADATGILETARQPWGGVASQVTDQSIVLVAGMETSVANAVKMGYLRKDSQGNYSDTDKAAVEEVRQRNGHQVHDRIGSTVDDSGDLVELHPEALEIIDEIIGPLPQSVYDGMVAKAISFGVESLDYNRLAQQMGTDPEDAVKRVEFILGNYKAAADQAVKGIVGSSVEDFHTWAATDATEAQKQAMLQMVLGNSTAAMKALAAQYMKASDPSDEALTQGGFPVKTEGGVRMVRVSGQWTSVKAAVKLGMI
jgi:hypothetical protein